MLIKFSLVTVKHGIGIVEKMVKCGKSVFFTTVIIKTIILTSDYAVNQNTWTLILSARKFIKSITSNQFFFIKLGLRYLSNYRKTVYEQCVEGSQ